VPEDAGRTADKFSWSSPDEFVAYPHVAADDVLGFSSERVFPRPYQRLFPDRRSGDYLLKVWIGLVADRHGADVLDAVHISIESSRRPVTTTIWRQVNVRRLTLEAIEEWVMPRLEAMVDYRAARQVMVFDRVDPDAPPGQRMSWRFGDIDDWNDSQRAFWVDFARRHQPPTVPPNVGRPTRITDDFLREVAQVHADAVKLGRDPQRAVEKHFHVPSGTAGRWITAARHDKGFIPPSGRRPRKENP